MSKNTWPVVRRILSTAVIGVTVGLSANAIQAGELTIYAAMDADKLKKAGDLFAASHPDIKVNWVRDSPALSTPV